MNFARRLIVELEEASKEGCPRCQDGVPIYEYPSGDIGHLIDNYGRVCYMAKTQRYIKDIKTKGGIKDE